MCTVKICLHERVYMHLINMSPGSSHVRVEIFVLTVYLKINHIKINGHLNKIITDNHAAKKKKMKENRLHINMHDEGP